jgi:hypothetical protein
MHRLARCARRTLIRMASGCAAVLLVGADAAGACTDSPIQYASTINRRLETQELRELYSFEFSDAFKARYSFGEFANNVANVQDSLRIGASRGRSFDGRTISRPSITGVWYPTQLGSHAESRELPPVVAVGVVVDLEFLTTSEYGKVRQKTQIVCAGDQWKVQGFWYQPSGSFSR